MRRRKLVLQALAVTLALAALIATPRPASARTTTDGDDDSDDGLYPTCENCIADGSNHYHNACPISGGVMVPSSVVANHRYYGSCSTAHPTPCGS